MKGRGARGSNQNVFIKGGGLNTPFQIQILTFLETCHLLKPGECSKLVIKNHRESTRKQEMKDIDERADQKMSSDNGKNSRK